MSRSAASSSTPCSLPIVEPASFASVLHTRHIHPAIPQRLSPSDLAHAVRICSATPFQVQSDTRKLLVTGLSILAVGASCAASVRLFFGGYTPHGPITNAGWLALVFALGCVPTGLLTLLLATLKLIGDARR